MKRFLQIGGGGKNHLPLLRKRTLATLAALLCMMALMPMTARAQGNVINTVVSSEQQTKTSTVYVGEVVVDGVSEIKYLYSGDITLNNTLLQNLLDGLNGMADGDYAALLEAYKVYGYIILPEERLALCSNPDLIADMDANWSSALYVGTLYYADKSVVSEINSNLYDLDAGFKAVLDAKTAERMETIDNPIDEPKSFVTHLGADATNNVWYTVENDQVIKHVETSIVYSSEVTTVIYTKVELETLMTETPLTFESLSNTLMINLYTTMSLYGLQYRTYNASNNTWSNWSTFSSGSTNNTCYVTGVGSKIQFKRENNAPLAIGYDAYSYFDNLIGNCYVYGNVMSLYNFETVLNDTYACFKLFDNNAGIRNHPTKDLVLGATTLSNSCYMYMFRNCTGLTRIPELPVTTLTNYCYYEMFRGCTALNTTPVLPATTLANYCYYGMFRECSSLTTPPELPVTTLANNCYCCMFCDCTNLQSAPVLPATIMAESCYGAMFAGCTSLQTAPELPATTLASDCYNEMFNRCTGLTIAPELPATVMVHKCYYDMFGYCTNLQTAPALPSTSMAYWCYNKMFEYCTSLTTAPVLPATTLAQGCYIWMFFGCSNLNYVKCLATDISADNCTLNWLTNVSPTGTFVKAAGMEDWEIGVNPDDGEYYGIPEGWNVENIDVFTTDGNWNVAINWSGNAVPADGSNVVIMANAIIPSGVTVNVDNIDLYGTLTIADGGQLYHNNDGVTATIKKNITAYGTETGVNNGWHLIGFSFADNGTIDEMDNLTANDYDLYYYNEPTHYWMNQKLAANNFTELEAARGYLYANSQTIAIGLKGTLNTANATVNVPLAYTEAAENLKGFNLVGNPFAHNVTTFAGANVASEVYRMNETMDNLMVSGISAADPLLPGEGFFVKATADDASITFNAQTRGESKATELVEVPTLTIDLLQDGLTIDRLVVKHEGEPLEKFTLRENGTRIYATEGGKDYAVVTVISSDSEANQTEIPVNFKAAKNGTYTISVNLENTDFGYLHLIDNLTGTDVDLLPTVIARNEAIQGTASYTFHAKTTDYASRFRLVFSVCGDANDDNEPFAYVDAAGNIIVNGGSSTGLETLQVVDVMGRVIVQGDAMKCKFGGANRVSTSGMTPGIYVLRLINGNDVRTQKIVVR